MGVIMYNGIQYTGAGGGGSDVTPNPEGSATDILKKLEIEDTIYGISNTIELTQAEYDDLPSSKLTDNILYIIKDAAGASGGNNKTLSGTVAPAAALGDNGDEYIQYHLSSNTPVIDAKYTKVRGQWITYQDDSTIVVPVAPAYSAGDHISISQSNEISATYSAFQGTDGTDPGSSGLVPAPAAADVDKVLKSDGTWGDAAAVEANPSGTATDELKKIDIDGTIYNIAGGAINVYGAFIDTSKILLPETRISGNGSYTAQEDGFITLLYYLGNWTTNVALDNENIISANKMTPNCWNYVIFPVKKGQELTYNLGYNGWLKIYGVKGGSNPISAPIIYSTEEREVGVWTDGKPLYQKTVIVTSIVSGNNTITHNISNIDRIVNTSGTFFATNNTSPIPNEISDNAWSLNMYDFGSTTFSLSIGSKWVQYFNHIQVTMQYTKSTDTPGSGKYNTLGVPTVHYTTDEQVIGTWFGKPLYQKCYDNLNITVQDNKWNNLITISNGQDCIELKVWGEFSEYFEMTPTTSHIDSTNGQLEARFVGLGADRIVKKLMVQYTKITD